MSAPLSDVDDSSPSLARRVNDEIRKRSHEGAAPFFCECSDGCLQVVWLDVLAYDRAVAGTSTVLLAADHEPCHVNGVPRRPPLTLAGGRP